jgi:hypothetical protein
MRTIALSLAALAVTGCTVADQQAAQTSAALAETELTQELRGRVAGPTQACVQLRTLGSNRSVGDAIIFERQTGRTIYVNRPAGGCPELRFNRALRTRAFSSQLCRGDIATVFDPVSGIEYGSCGLGDFTPYRLASR